ncbi:FeoA family protein [Kingella negevensis]|uniref:FeoA family protein n=1 Tax=Kingella negevensis TaxID=1522312 RepID=UPI000A26DD16|nr:FeoA domain-containing protein [Kingella negevensis]WII90058.1 FeoA domain-containing protein [Kingella negevensis]
MEKFELHKLPKNTLATIQTIAPNPEFGELDVQVSQRLTDLGFNSGTSIQIIATGIFGVEPYAVRLDNQSQFSLRRAEAKKILCSVSEEKAA